MGVDLGLDIQEIFHAGVSASVAETTGTSVGEGGSDTCPVGAWECALAVTPYMVAISGVQSVQDSCTGEVTPANYVIQSPHTDASNSKHYQLLYWRDH